MTPTTLLHESADLLSRAQLAAADTSAQPMLDDAVARIDAPLRVAVAGRLKSGKSTLVNALLGEMAAATDATECTRIVTWYVNGPTYAAYRVGRDGHRQPVGFERDGLATRILIDDDDSFADDEQLVLQMPSTRLGEMTIIDTPGVDSVSEVLVRRADALFAPEDHVSPVDAVIYLFTHRHPHDLEFLDTFHGDLNQGLPVNAIGVLARADEIAGASVDALAIAGEIARAAAADPVIRNHTHTVIPVCALLAGGAETLRESDAAALRQLAAWPDADLDRGLLAVQTLLIGPAPEPQPEHRRRLLDLIGLYGVRLATRFLRANPIATTQQLTEFLVGRSGLPELRTQVETRFASRASVLKARSALAAISHATAVLPDAVATALGHDIERIVSGAHELTELRMLEELRTIGAPLPEDDAARLERLFGGSGADATRRLALDPESSPDEVAEAARRELARWREYRELGIRPGVRGMTDAAIRTCEGLVLELTQ